MYYIMYTPQLLVRYYRKTGAGAVATECSDGKDKEKMMMNGAGIVNNKRSGCAVIIDYSLIGPTTRFYRHYLPRYIYGVYY